MNRQEQVLLVSVALSGNHMRNTLVHVLFERKQNANIKMKFNA